MDEKNITRRRIIDGKSNFEITNDYLFYNRSQQQEFEADEQAIRIPVIQDEEKENLLEAALFVLCYFELYDTVRNYLDPPFNQIKTHPNSIERIHRLYNSFKNQIPSCERTYNDLLELINTSKEELIDDAGFNTDTYEVVGSIYLAQPNTEWRGKELIDRRDF